jgi:hypothetical protein
MILELTIGVNQHDHIWWLCLFQKLQSVLQGVAFSPQCLIRSDSNLRSSLASYVGCTI